MNSYKDIKTEESFERKDNLADRRRILDNCNISPGQAKAIDIAIKRKSEENRDKMLVRDLLGSSMWLDYAVTKEDVKTILTKNHVTNRQDIEYITNIYALFGDDVEKYLKKYKDKHPHEKNYKKEDVQIEDGSGVIQDAYNIAAINKMHREQYEEDEFAKRKKIFNNCHITEAQAKDIDVAFKRKNTENRKKILLRHKIFLDMAVTAADAKEILAKYHIKDRDDIAYIITVYAPRSEKVEKYMAKYQAKQDKKNGIKKEDISYNLKSVVSPTQGLLNEYKELTEDLDQLYDDDYLEAAVLDLEEDVKWYGKKKPYAYKQESVVDNLIESLANI